MVGIITALSFSSFIGPSDVLYADISLRLSRSGFSLSNKKAIGRCLRLRAGFLRSLPISCEPRESLSFSHG